MGKRSSLYLHPQQRDQIHHLASGFLWRSELPTWIVIITLYSGWFATLAYWKTLGLLPATLLLIGFTTWYMSLQHELIHGHPTRFAWLNALFARFRWRCGIRMVCTGTLILPIIATIA